MSVQTLRNISASRRRDGQGGGGGGGGGEERRREELPPDELLPRAKRLLERSNNHRPREHIIDRPEVELEAGPFSLSLSLSLSLLPAVDEAIKERSSKDEAGGGSGSERDPSRS